jgi:hypothetical protein
MEYIASGVFLIDKTKVNYYYVPIETAYIISERTGMMPSWIHVSDLSNCTFYGVM